MKILNTGQRLRIAWLFYGMMFFYGIEQLFLNHVLKDPSARAYLTVVFTVSLVVFDIPTGMLADRISRKLCLLLASAFQILALAILGLSTNLLEYVIGSFLFGIFICLINGAAQALLYDWLATKGQTKLYGREQGRHYAVFLIGAGIANVASGFIANAISLRSTYFLSMIPALLAMLVVVGLKDPPFAKKQAVLWYKQLGEIVNEVARHKKVLIYTVHFIAAALILYTIGEFGQIYLLAFGVSTAALGILWAITAVFAAGGRALAHRLQAYPRLLIAIFCLVVFIFCLVHNRFGIALFWLVYGLNEAVSNVAETEIQHETSSHIRATTLSVISFVGNIIAIPVILIFNQIYLHHGIFKANQAIGVVVVFVLLLTLFARPPRKTEKLPPPNTLQKFSREGLA